MKVLGNTEIHALIAEEQRMDAIAHNLTNEERLHICDMGFYNTVISGYLIKAMENSSFSKADIAVVSKAYAGPLIRSRLP